MDPMTRFIILLVIAGGIVGYFISQKGKSRGVGSKGNDGGGGDKSGNHKKGKGGGKNRNNKQIGRAHV